MANTVWGNGNARAALGLSPTCNLSIEDQPGDWENETESEDLIERLKISSVVPTPVSSFDSAPNGFPSLPSNPYSQNFQPSSLHNNSHFTNTTSEDSGYVPPRSGANFFASEPRLQEAHPYFQAQPVIRILKKPTQNSSQGGEGGTNGTSIPTVTPQKTFEERQREYAIARSKIFNEPIPLEFSSSDSQPEISFTNSLSSPNSTNSSPSLFQASLPSSTLSCPSKTSASTPSLNSTSYNKYNNSNPRYNYSGPDHRDRDRDRDRRGGGGGGPSSRQSSSPQQSTAIPQKNPDAPPSGSSRGFQQGFARGRGRGRGKGGRGGSGYDD
jgi:hypothetical protein